MAYSPTTWQNDFPPDIDDVHLNKMETGIRDAHTLSDANASGLAALTTRVTAVESNGGGGGRRFTYDALSRGAKIDGTDNTLVLQTILDTIRDNGYGELYLPGKAGDTYNSKGLWVDSGTRIVSDPGVILNITGPSGHHAKDALGKDSIVVDGDMRLVSWDGDLVASDGLFITTQTRLGYDRICQNVSIENLTVKDGTVVCWAVQGLDLINFGRTGGFFGVAFTGFKNGHQGYGQLIGDPAAGYCSDVRVLDGFVKSVVRNGYELSSVRDLIIRGALVDTILGTTSGPQDPGAGIENECESGTAHGFNIKLIDNTIRNCAGAGIAFIRNDTTWADRCIVRGNTIESVATTQYGGGSGPTNVGTQGAIWVNGKGNGGEEVMIVEGNQARLVTRGGMLAAGDFYGQVVATSNVCKNGSTGTTGTFRSANFLSNNVGL